MPSSCPVSSGKSVVPARPISPGRGADRESSRTRVEMRWTEQRRRATLVARTTNGAVADGEVVWSWRPDAGVKLRGGIRQATVAKKPGHRGELEVSRNPSRREGRSVSAEPVCSCAFSFVQPCTRDRGYIGCDLHRREPRCTEDQKAIMAQIFTSHSLELMRSEMYVQANEEWWVKRQVKTRADVGNAEMAASKFPL